MPGQQVISRQVSALQFPFSLILLPRSKEVCHRGQHIKRMGEILLQKRRSGDTLHLQRQDHRTSMAARREEVSNLNQPQGFYYCKTLDILVAELV